MRKYELYHVHQLLQQTFGGLTLTPQHIKQLRVAYPLFKNLLRAQETETGWRNPMLVQLHNSNKTVNKQRCHFEMCNVHF